MAINPDRQFQRLKISRGLLEKDPTNTNLAARVHNQELALADAEKAYPKALLRHLRHLNGQADIKNRTKKMALDLAKGIPIPKKPGEK